MTFVRKYTAPVLITAVLFFVSGNGEILLSQTNRRIFKVSDERENLFYFPASVIQSRGVDGKTSVEFSIGILSRLVKWERISDYKYSTVLYEILFYDNEGKLVTRYKNSARLTTRGFSRTQLEIFENSATKYVIQKKFELFPGTYKVEINAQDVFAGTMGYIEDKITVENFNDGALRISDIMFSVDVIESGNEAVDEMEMTTFIENLKISQTPSHVIPLDHPIYISYEIYNLTVRKGDGNNNYRVQYGLTPIKKFKVENIRHTEIIKNITPDKAVENLGIAYTNYNQGPTDTQFMKIEHSIKDEGKYLLTLRITDNISDNIVEKSIPIWFYKN